MTDKLLEVTNLRISFPLEEGILKAVNGVSFSVKKNQTLGIVGESGCGKSITAKSLLQIVPKPGQVEGEILFHHGDNTRNLLQFNADEPAMRAIRGQEIAMVFQEPMTAFSPIHTIGDQITEALLVHGMTDTTVARQMAIEMLNKVGIPAAERRIDEYPFQLSGGMRQRCMIAMAMITSPALLVADEPTTALDVTIQAQILRLMKQLQREIGMSIIFITHDLGVIANMADEVAVMYLGHIVEYGSVEQIFSAPKHPYTQGLMRAVPRVGQSRMKRLETIEGNVPTPIDMPPMCPFANRCAEFIAGKCDQAFPQSIEIEPGHTVNCVLYEN